MTRAKEANESSKTDPDESKHREDLYQNAGGDNSRYVIDSKAGWSFGEPQRPADGSDFLFVSQKGGRLDRTAVFRLFQAITATAGLPAEKRHPHCLKHSLASHLVAGNVNLALIKQALGHRSINSTMKYIGTTDSQAADENARALMALY